MKRAACNLTICCFAIILSLTCKPSEPVIQISQVWSRPAFAATDSSDRMNYNGVVYFKISNSGGRPDRLLAVQTDVAQRTEIHLSRLENGVMKMEHLDSGVKIPAGDSVEFKPGSYHVMLLGLRRSLETGQQFKVTFRFESSGEINVQSEVTSQ